MTNLSRRNFLAAGAASLAFVPAFPASANPLSGRPSRQQVALAADYAWLDPHGYAEPCRFALRPTVPALPDVDLDWMGI